jgi:hypothetical protein
MRNKPYYRGQHRGGRQCCGHRANQSGIPSTVSKGAQPHDIAPAAAMAASGIPPLGWLDPKIGKTRHIRSAKAAPHGVIVSPMARRGAFLFGIGHLLGHVPFPVSVVLAVPQIYIPFTQHRHRALAFAFRFLTREEMRRASEPLPCQENLHPVTKPPRWKVSGNPN